MPRLRAHSFISLRGAASHWSRFVIACLLFAVARSARASELALHVVIVGQPTSPLLRRLREESEALGFVVDAKTSTSAALDSELDAPGVVAAIRQREPPDEALELVIADPELSERIRETLPIHGLSDPTSREVVATRAIELLRAVRLHIEQAAPPVRPPEPVASVNAPAATVETVASPATAIALTPLLTYAPGFNLALSADLSVSYVPRQIGVRAGLLLPLTAQRLEHAGGDITATASAIHASVIVRTNQRVAGAELGLGLEASRVHFEGHAAPPLVNTDSNVYTLGPRLEASGTLRLASRLRLLLPLALSYALPRTVVRFAGEPLRDWGPLIFRAGLGVELEVP
jgi:hypothetical protein